MVLVLHAIQVFQVSPHLERGFSNLRHLDMLELVKTEDCFAHFVIKQGITSHTLIFRQDTHAVRRNRLCPFHFEQQVKDAKREQVTFGPLKGGRNIRESEQETDNVIPVSDDFYQPVVSSQEYVIHGVLDVTLGEWVI